MPRQVPALPIVQTGNPEVDRLQTFLRQTVERLRAPQDKWIAPTLLSGWVNYSPGSFLSAGYMKDSQGFVHLRGTVKSGTAGTIFVLPSGYRPSLSAQYAVDSNAAHGICRVDPTGAVIQAAGSNVYCTLDGINFDTR